METSGYATLSRQQGLLREMQTIAHNIANVETTGFKQENLIFTEFVSAQGNEEANSISMARAGSRNVSFSQGDLEQTNGAFDLAIEGDGFFQVETANGVRFTRAGHFMRNQDGDLVSPDGHKVLDAGNAPVFVPPDARHVGIAPDGTISVEGKPIGQIGVFLPEEKSEISREGGVFFKFEGDPQPAENANILQGFVESSNVNPILQISRMIEVQRAYELGQSFLEAEDSRLRDAVETLIR
ncbi:MAG: flagellar hook-basal body complex protein [Paracoccaceae bacterium]